MAAGQQRTLDRRERTRHTLRDHRWRSDQSCECSHDHLAPRSRPGGRRTGIVPGPQSSATRTSPADTHSTGEV